MEGDNAAICRVVGGATEELPGAVVSIVSDEAHWQAPIEYLNGCKRRRVWHIGEGPGLSHIGSSEAA
jgi:hypothetical protein